MAKVKLYGALGERFGKEFDMDVTTVRDTVRGLSANLPGFLSSFRDPDCAYKVVVDGTAISEEGLYQGHLHPPKEIRIIPIVGGSKSGGDKILAGAALIAAAYFAPTLAGEAAGMIGGTSFAALAQGAIMNIGISMAITGVAEVLLKPPKPQDVTEVKRSESHLMNGPRNVGAQGRPIPVGYGRLRIGSRIVSAGLYTEDY